MTAIQVTEEQLLLLWGKTCRRKDDPEDFASRYHPLLFHLLDVAHAALALWDEVLPVNFKSRMASALRCDEEAARLVVAFLAGAHDLGKASPGFQFQSTTLGDWMQERLLEQGFSRPPRPETAPHNFVSTKELLCVLRDPASFWRGGNERSNTVLAHIPGAHHGTFPRFSDYASLGEDVLGDAMWSEVRLALLHSLREALCRKTPGFVFPVATWDAVAAGAVPQLAGFISVADWIGSSFELVGHRDKEHTLAEYVERLPKKASEALSDFGWKRTPAPQGARPDFAALWRFEPNALQEAVIERTRDVAAPFFLLVEAPMGVGKTEAALWASDAAQTPRDGAQAEGVNSGFYIALPTQATSDAMHGRVEKFLERRYKGESAIHLQLVHSHAGMSDNVKVVRRGLEPIYDQQLTSEEARVVAASWFCGPKRPLLAPFGVGTIDQSLLAALQTRHWFVRMFGLAGKVVVFDEVHAYDTYMSRLLVTLIAWLREIGCSVILLSATLPSEKRGELTRAWGGGLPAEEAAYPRLTWLEGDQRTATSLPVDPRDLKHATVAVRHLRPDELGRALREKLAEGGCAAIICNTVVEAQQMFERLRAELGDVVPPDDWILFHARMPFGWRKKVEDTVVERFGKQKAGRPRRAVVVATQVIEQSLDLDFDWMGSFMAPGDLLLQRMGRLHRHAVDEHKQRVKRPAPVSTPQLAVLCDADSDEVPSFGRSECVYEPEMLLRTWLVWRGRQEVQLPVEIETLVKAVYDDEPQAPDARWQEAINRAAADAEDKRNKAEKTAGNVVMSVRNDNGRLRSPSELAESPSRNLHDDDDPTTHETLRAATRSGDPSVTVVCLCKHEGQLYLFNLEGKPDSAQPPLDLEAEPTPGLTRKLVEHSLSISHRGLFATLCREEVPVGWKKSPMLRHSRKLVFENNVNTDYGCRLRLDHVLGLLIEKEEAEQQDAPPPSP